jgi:hypothetical protein
MKKKVSMACNGKVLENLLCFEESEMTNLIKKSDLDRFYSWEKAAVERPQ